MLFCEFKLTELIYLETTTNYNFLNICIEKNGYRNNMYWGLYADEYICNQIPSYKCILVELKTENQNTTNKV